MNSVVSNNLESGNDTAAQPTVFIIDDNDDILTLLESALSGLPCIIVTEKSPVKALCKLQEGTIPSIIIADFLMPEMNGIDFLRAARGKTPDAYNMLLTGLFDLEKHTIAIEDGVVDRIVTKPLEIQKFIQLIDSLL